MRVALIGCTVNPRVGGMGRALYDHAVALAEAGQEVTVYALDTPHLKSLVHIGKAAWGARFDPSLDAYDVVHLHLPFFGVAERVVLEMLKQVQHDRKLVATYHMDAIGTGLKKIYFNWWYRHRFKKVLAACDAIAVTSRAYAHDSQLSRAGVNVEKCEEILLRVDTDVFNPETAQGHTRAQECGIFEGEGCLSQAESLSQENSASEPLIKTMSYLLFVGALDRAHYFKGVSLLLQALAQTRDAKLVIVGKGELLSQYEKEAAQLGIADRVHFTGGVTDEELARWYAGARALVLPSTDRSEAFGIVLIEAMACGTPVIASDLPGVRAVVERVHGGVLVPAGIASLASRARNDPLSSAMQAMWQHPWSTEERAALAARTAAMYGRATLADQLMRWYTSVHVPSR